MKTNEEITSYEPKNFKENYKAYLVVKAFVKE